MLSAEPVSATTASAAGASTTASSADAARDLTNAAAYTYQRCPTSAAEAAAGAPEVVANDRALRRTYTQVYTIRSRATANPRQFLPG